MRALENVGLSWPLAVRYGGAAALVAVGAGVHGLLLPPDALPFILFYPVTVAALCLFGLGPALLALLLGAFSGWLGIHLTDTASYHLLHLLIYLFGGGLTCLLIDWAMKSRQQLQNSLQQNRQLLMVSPVPMGLFAEDGTITFVNSHFTSLFGYQLQDIPTVSDWWEKAYPDPVYRQWVIDHWMSQEQLPEASRDGIPAEEYKITCKDGTERFVEISGIVSPEGCLACFADRTALHESDRQRQTLLDELRSSNEELEQFAYVASHDMREPLRMINSYLTLLERRYGALLDGDGLEFLNFARNGARRMDHLVLDLLEFSRIGRIRQPMVQVRFDDLLLTAQTLLSSAISDSGARLDIPEKVSWPLVTVEGEQIVRVLQNLIGNAIKYRAPDREPLIRLDCQETAEGWQFSVTDNGIGIEPKYYDRIFMIFQRLHGHGSYEGTGIGLAVCKKIVERHGGKIWVDSTPGAGTTFTFSLPRDGRQPVQP